MHTHQLTGPALALLALGCLAALTPSAHAAVAPPTQYQIVYDKSYQFTPSVAPGSPDALLLTFGQAQSSPSFAPSEFTLEPVSSTFDQNYNLDVQAISGTGHYALRVNPNNNGSAVTNGYFIPGDASLYNNGAATNYDFSTVPRGYAPNPQNSNDGLKEPNDPGASSLYLPFSSVGGTAQFFLIYADDPTSTPFTMSEQYTDPVTDQTVTKTLISGDFNSDGTFTPNGGSPAPEPSQVGMLALMGLGLGSLLLRARRRA